MYTPRPALPTFSMPNASSKNFCARAISGTEIAIWRSLGLPGFMFHSSYAMKRQSAAAVRVFVFRPRSGRPVSSGKRVRALRRAMELSRLGNRRGFRRIGDLDHQILHGLGRAGVARDCVQGIGRLVERFTRSEPLQRTIVDLHFVRPLEDIAERVAAGMAVRTAAVAGVALGPADRDQAAHHVGHRRLEEIDLAHALSGLRLRMHRCRRKRGGPAAKHQTSQSGGQRRGYAADHGMGCDIFPHELLRKSMTMVNLFPHGGAMSGDSGAAYADIAKTRIGGDPSEGGSGSSRAKEKGTAGR